MTEPLTDEQHTAIRQRIADVIRPRMLIGLQDAELYDEPGRERINEWADSIATWATEVVQPELDRLRAELATTQAQLTGIWPCTCGHLPKQHDHDHALRRNFCRSCPGDTDLHDYQPAKES